jgi:tetratricopeptide (TPR) repeat protein
MASTDRDGETVVERSAVDSAAEPMARVRPGAAAGAALSRARVLGAIFGEHSDVGAVGRFRVLDRLGAGGMGVVYEAYDPQLARGVALKLVEVTAEDHEIALAEAKALARLSHPNVVPIYDVGVVRDRVYLVMELVRGTTLAHWAPGRTPREILEVYQQAGSALAAAHDAGLVHRDFKPQNAIVGAEGRVRVVDFGLACEADDPARETTGRPRIGGTPRFMAPEAKTGAAITPAADQYSFCVSLGEALAAASERPPRRIAELIERGSAADPARRFASMRDLLRALARDPARARRRIAATAGIGASIGALAFALGRTTPGDDAAACDGGAARLDAVWSPAARSAALARIAGFGPYGRSLQLLLAAALDGYTRDWVAADRAACIDRRRGIETARMSDRRTICLQRGSDALTEVRELFVGADPASLTQLPLAVQSMQSTADPSSCAKLTAVSSDVPSPPDELVPAIARTRSQIARARVQVDVGRSEPAAADAGAAVAEARRLGYRPLLAEALLVQGQAQMDLDPPAAAVPTLREATRVAMEAFEEDLAIEAWARRAFVQGAQGEGDRVLADLELIEPLASRTSSAAFARALLYNNLGSVELGRSHTDEARAYYERALRESRKVTGRGALELVGIRANLALVAKDRKDADRWIAEAADELDARLGGDHPRTLRLREMRGLVMTEDVRQADAILTPVCQGYELHPGLASSAASCWTEVGLLRWDRGERERAIEAMTRASHASADAVEPAAYLALLGRDPRRAARQFADAIAALPVDGGEHNVQSLTRGTLQVGLGRARYGAGEWLDARKALDQALAALEPLARTHPTARMERLIGRARVALADTLRAMGAPPAEIAPVEASAAAWRASAGLADRER